MTVSSTTTKVSYSGDGSTTVFAYSFKIFADADLRVIERASDGTETVKSLTTHYTVSGAGTDSGGNVTFSTAPASGVTVIIKRNLTLTQGTDYVANDPFPAESHEEALDRLTFIAQGIQEELDRTIKASETNTISGAEFTVSASDRANKVFAFDASGDLAVTQEIGTFRGNWAASTAYKQRDLVKDTSTNNIFIVNSAHTSSGAQPLTTNANSAKYDLIVDAASASTSATNAATSETNAGTSETNAAASAASALSHKNDAETAKTASETAKTAAEAAQTAAETAQTAAETALDTFDDRFLGAKSSDPATDNDGNALLDGAIYFDTTNDLMKVYDLSNTQWRQLALTGSNQTNVNTVAGQISPTNNIATVAARDSDIGTVAARDSDIGTVASRDANIGTVASRDADIGTVASRDTDIGTVAARDADIGTVAGKATEIGRLGTADAVADMAILGTADVVSDLNTLATSAIVADMDALADIASNITTVADNVTGVNSFAERYRVSANAPTNSLDAGDLWFDSTNNIMKVYGSGGFVNAGSSVNGTSERQDYVVGTTKGSYDGSTTVFPATYDSGFVDVYLNGIKLQPADFTATNGTSVTLGTAAQTSDTVSIVGYGTFQLSNFSIGDANNVDLTGLANDQFLQYNSTSGKFEAATVTTDLSGDSTPQLGGNLDVNGNSIVSASNGDISITPNGTGSVIIDGLSHPQSDGSAGQFLKTDGSGQLSFGTVATDLSGDSTPQLGGNLDTNSNNINFADNDKAQFGAGNDLQIYHNGSNSFVDDAGTGNLHIRASSQIKLQKYTGENIFVGIADGAASLYHDNSQKLATTSTGVTITGDITADNLATPAGAAQKGSYQSLSRSTWTKITGFTTGEYDSDSAFNGSRFTVPSGEGGRYLITCNLHLDFSSAGGDGEQGIAAFYINGTRRQQIFRLSMGNGGRHMGHLAGTAALIYDLSDGHYVEVYAYMQDDSASGTLQVRGNANEGSRFGFMRIN